MNYRDGRGYYIVGKPFLIAANVYVPNARVRVGNGAIDPTRGRCGKRCRGNGDGVFIKTSDLWTLFRIPNDRQIRRYVVPKNNIYMCACACARVGLQKSTVFFRWGRRARQSAVRRTQRYIYAAIRVTSH